MLCHEKEEEVPESSVVPREEEEANEEDDEEGARAAAMKRFDENFVEALKPLGTKVLNDKHCASRTISGLLSTLMTVLCEPSELDTKALKALQSLGELNRETEHSLKAGLERNSQLQAYLRAKEERLKQEREDYEKAHDMKLNWIRTKVTELTAEKNETEKGLDYHHDIEEFVVRAFELLKKAQDSDDASLFQWRGLKYDLSRKGVEELTKPTLAEGILMDILRTAETGTTVVQEVETKLVDLENRAKPAMIVDYEEDEKEVPSSHQREKKKEKEDQSAAEKPKPKSAPAATEEKEKPQIKKVPTTKKMPKFPEKSTQEDDDSKVEMKKVKEESKPWEEYFVPKEHLSVKVSQHVWSQLGIFSRQRLLKEHQTNAGEACFACQKEGHRSYYCDTMIIVAQRLSNFFNQPSGGQRASQTVFCSCCWLYNMRMESKRQRDYAKVSGWFTHPRNMCKYKDSCDLKPESVIAKMQHHELRAHLIELELIHEDEGKTKEKDARKVEIVSEGEPEKKKRKKEKKDEEKKEKKETQRKEEEKKRQAEEAAKKKAKEDEEKKRKEAEEFKQSLRGETTAVLHGYLFESSYRCTPHKMEQQAKYEKSLPYEVLVRTPNYISRLEEANEHNKRQI